MKENPLKDCYFQEILVGYIVARPVFMDFVSDLVRIFMHFVERTATTTWTTCGGS